MGYLDHTPDKEVMVSLISTLQTVTEGKVSTLIVSVKHCRPPFMSQLHAMAVLSNWPLDGLRL